MGISAIPWEGCLHRAWIFLSRTAYTKDCKSMRKEREEQEHSQHLQKPGKENISVFQQSGELFRDFLENLCDIAYEADSRGNVTYANRMSEVITGVPLKDIIGKPFLPLFTKESQQIALDAYQRTLNGESPEYDLTFTNGRTCGFKNEPLKNEDGQIVGVFGIARDITDRKRAEEELTKHRQHLEELVQKRTAELLNANNALRQEITERKRTEEALRQSEGRLEGILSSLNETIIILFDRQGKHKSIWTPSEIEERYGFRSKDVVGMSLSDIFPPDDASRRLAAIQCVFEKGEPLHDECLTHVPGGDFWNDVYFSPVRGASGEITAVIAFIRDITMNKRAEQALRESEEKFRNLAEQSPNMIFINKGGRVVYANRRCEEIMGYKREEFYSQGFSFLSLQAPEFKELVKANFFRHMNGEDIAPHEITLLTKEGRRIEAIITPKVIRYEGENAVLGIVTDISERKLAEKESQQHLAELTRAWHINTIGEMASGLAHELNQPLCAILNYSNGCVRMIQRDNIEPDKIRSAVEQIAVQAERAGDIIRRIRSLVAKREPCRSTVDINNIVGEAIAMVKAEARQKNITIHCELADDIRPVEADRVEIQQVILNLVKNAFEAITDSEADRREVTISTSSKENDTIELAVNDTGKGLLPETCDRIFDSFYTTKDQGLGVGLSLSRRIVEAHGGQIWAESGNGSGATFRFTLPKEGVQYGQHKPHCVCSG